MASIISAGTTSGSSLSMTGDTSGQLQLATNGSTTALTIDTSQNATFAGTVAMSSSFLRNRIINGDMRIDQRNAGASVTASVTGTFTYGVDRFGYQASQASKFTMQQNAGSVTPPTGFNNYLGITSSSAYTVGASDYFFVGQPIEGFNIADLAWGTANAKTVTVSFWVRSSLTGTFGGSLSNTDASRSYPFSYTISVANTWEQKTITIAGDTTGTWLTTTGRGINVFFGLGVGSTYSGTANAWAAANYIAPTGATSVVGTSGATFYITGVQLEVGTSATPFERRLYNQELANCQRYYEVATIPSSTSLFVSSSSAYNAGQYQFWQLKQTKRASPTVSIVASIGGGISTYTGVDVIQLYNASTGFYISGSGAGTVGITASAEL